MDMQQPNSNTGLSQNADQSQQQNQTGQSSSGFGRLKIIFATLFLVGLVAVVLWQQLSTTDQSQPAETDGVTVAITEGGFEPETILVNPGTNITWVNESDNPARVASNPHPDHDGLPGLDSQGVVGPGATYSFVFEEAGEFGYHDHYNPETNGIVVVKEQE